MSNRAGSTLKSFLFGATIGAIAGLLYAPEEGKKTRKKVKEMSGVAKEKAEEISKEAGREFNTLREKVEEKSQEFSEKQETEKPPRKKSSRPRKFKGV